MIRLPLAAVLRHDHARHGLEHLAVAHERALFQLFRSDRTLAGRLRNAHEVLGGIFHVGEIRERALARHGDVGVQREVKDGVNLHGGR